MRRRPDGFFADRGVILPFFASTVFLLLGLAAFATDLGWFYVNANRIQRAADAGALAGVIHMPQRFDLASAAAEELALANGYEDGLDGAVVVVEAVPGEPNRLDVTITDTVDTYFLKALGRTSQTIVRKARAEFIPPLPLGSPGNQFGNDPVGGNFDNFWANIHGYHTDTKKGDAYSAFCADGQGDGPPCSQNPGWRERGYIYGVDIPAGAGNIQTWILDGAFHNQSGGNPNGDPIRTGDVGCGGCQGPTTRFILYAPDPTPLDLSDNTPLCSVTYSPEPQVAASAPYAWDLLCALGNPAPGIYPLQVVIDPNPGDDANNDGLNRYSVKVESAGTPARLYGLGDISIFNNASAVNTSFYLAEVAAFYRGKTFVVELYDPGDAVPGGVVQILGPGGAAWSSCTMFERAEVADAWVPRGTQSPCQFDADRSIASQNYDGDWIKVEIDLPEAYACVDCWWKVNYNYPGAVFDTTTWRAYMLGNPVHLIPLG